MTLSAIPHTAAGKTQTLIIRASRLTKGDFILLGPCHARVLSVEPWGDDRWPRDLEEIYRIEYVDADGRQAYLLPKASEEFRTLVPADRARPRPQPETVSPETVSPETAAQERRRPLPRTFVA